MIKKLFTLTGVLFSVVFFAQKTHAVTQGDTAYSISKKYGLSLDELFRLNPSIKEGKISIGDVLNVQASTSKQNAGPSLGTIIVQPKQTIYGLTKRFKISEQDLKKYNPQLETEGLKVGEQLSLPIDKIKKYAEPQEIVVQVASAKPSIIAPVTPKDEFVNYTVESGDTIFSLVQKFGSSIDELLAWNPNLSQGLKAGMSIRVKKIETAYKKKSGDVLGIVLMLPFGYNSNDTKYRNVSAEFLTGAQLAIERNAKRGQKLDVIVVDAGNEQSFKNSLSQINVNNTDLIIGPFFKSSVLEALEYVGDKKIPVVSPFANSEDLYDYNNLIIVEPNDKVYADKIADEIAKVYSNQKIYIVAGSTNTKAPYLQAQLQKGLKNPNIIIVSNAKDIVVDKNMMTGQPAPVIAVLADDQNAIGEDFSIRMQQISKEVVGNRAFSMYFVPSFEKKVDDLSQVNLVYLMDRKINTTGTFEKEILADFKKKYCKEPSKYAIIGFDVTNDILSRENSNGELFKKINEPQTQLATKFEFVKTKNNGAYINTGFRIVRLIP
ncbi:MAG: LysM peptidoglycan-binding domain-containing protein [Bacteroidetes bacterium]|nr:LysM peptidoglycan-binding domain-containing protein [Bacteroidota bacterium]